jgi:hypothetical protein
MHLQNRLIVAAAATLMVGSSAAAQDQSRGVTDGGIKVAGWQGQVDAREAQAGMTLSNAKLESAAGGLHVVTGPAVAYWNPENKASGNYTVKATFTESKFMGLNNHPHPYGIFIGGNDLGSNAQSYLYCAAYGNGRFIVRGFGPDAFQLNGPRGETNEAIGRASAPGQPVTQEVALSVTGDKVECAINGKVVASYAKADLVAAGRLKSTDGVYGVRFGHNTEATVSGLTMQRLTVTKN